MTAAALDLRTAGRSGGAAAALLGGALLIGGLAVLSPGLALAATLGVIFVGVTLRSLPAGLAVFTVLTFFERIPGVGGSAALVKLAGAVLVVSWLLSLARGREGAPVLLRDHPILSYAVVGLCGFALASMLWAPDVEIARFNALRLVQVVVLFFIVYTALSERRHVRWLVLAFVSGAALTAIVGLAGATSAESFDAGQETSRFVGQIGDPNELAAILVPALAFVLFALAAFRSPLLRWLLATFAIVLSTALFLTESRGGLVGLFVMSVAAVVLAGRFRPRALAAVLTVAALGVSYYTLVAPPQSLQRITNFAAEGGTGRTDLWSIALEVAEDHPVAGVGIGNFVVVEPSYASRDIAISQVRLVVDTPKIAHNMYLQVLSELGVVGLALFVGILATSLSLAWKSVRAFARAGDFELEMIARGVIVGLIGMLAAYSFISAQYEKQLWLLFGLSTALYAVARRHALQVTPARLSAELLPRERRSDGPEYDPAVADRVVEQLEQRLTEKMDALLVEQERLQRRRTALVERERELADQARELESKSAELDARARIVKQLELAPSPPAAPAAQPVAPPPMREADTRREEELAARERRLAAREAESAAAAQRLEERIAAVSARELALAKSMAQLAARERELEAARKVEPPPERTPAPEPVQAPPIPQPAPAAAPVPEAPAAAAAAAGGLAWSLPVLERLVAEHGEKHPEQQDEWSYYLLYLRDFAQPDGSLPDSFDSLLNEVFGDLLRAPRQA